eukprot:Hpha_TRINITY_DN22720_c0_g1::TRINITY_DN22720_c0_g1_i1::g.34283::m.34283
MPKFSLRFRCELHNIDRMQFPSDTRINLKCQHPSSGDEFPNIWVDPSEELEIPGSRGTCNVLVKVAQKRYGTIVIDAKDFTYTQEDADKGFKEVCVLDCREIEPVKWLFDSEPIFTATGLEGYGFDEVKFDEGEWYDYDEKGSCETSITNIQCEFKRV